MQTNTEALTITHQGVQVTVPLKAVAVALLGENGQGTPSISLPVGMPRIGDSIHGGIFAGIARGRDGAPDYYLICGPEADDDLNWEAGKKWAEGLQLHGFSDYTLPTRKEQALLFANVGDLFKPRWYWSSEQHAGDSDYAWFQNFEYGYQYFNHKSYGYRVRAVRRSTIQ